MSENITAVEQKQTQALTLRGEIEGEGFKLALAQALPKFLTAERFVRMAITAMTRTPKLKDCTRMSFFKCLMDLAALGIEPDGRRAHLIPYKRKDRETQQEYLECQLIIDYKGLAELVYRSGMVSTLHADVVCENDLFKYDRGEIKEHVIDFKKPRGKAYAAYAICRFKDGGEKCEVMNYDEIEGIRKRSKSGNVGPWVTDRHEMDKKTVFRRLSKWLPISAEVRDAFEKDDDQLAPINSLVVAKAEPLNPFTLPEATDDNAADQNPPDERE